MQQPEPIHTIDLFPILHQKLISLLKSLSKEDWEKRTIATQWNVKDVAVHLLDGNIRTLSMLRDNYFGEKPANNTTYQDLVQYLNRLNADWVKAMQRVSPAIFVGLLEITGQEYNAFLRTLNPYQKATFSVAWAGEQESANWFHIAREYTEKWHHQQQIRLAVSKEAELYTKELYFPHLNTSMRALPYHFREINGTPGDLIEFKITGAGGGKWFLYHNGENWQLLTESEVNPVCTVIIAGEIAWRLFTKGISRTEAEQKVTITGRSDLGAHIFSMLAVMA